MAVNNSGTQHIEMKVFGLASFYILLDCLKEDESISMT